MARIDENGFLEGRIGSWIADNGVRHAPVFACVRDLNRECHRFLSGRKVDLGSVLQNTTFVLFARLMELFQGMFVAVEHGMSSVSNVAFRAFLEAYFHLGAIHKDTAYLNQYLDQLHIFRKELVNKIRNSNNPSLNELRGALDENLAREICETVRDQDIKPLTIEEVARRAGLEVVYLTAYQFLSGAVHTTALDLESHVAYDKTKMAIQGFRYGPSDSDTEKNLGLAGLCMADALKKVSSIFGEDRASLCGMFTNRFQAVLDQKSPQVREEEAMGGMRSQS